jgi:hypothetical protein
MNGLLSDVMNERADGLERTAIDVAGIVHEGDRRVRRRRTAALGGAAALTLAVAVAVPALVGGRGPGDDTVTDPDLAAAFVAHTPSYAVGSEVTVDGTTFDVGHTVRAYVQTDVGVVFSDAEGTVWAANGADVTEVGTVNAKVPRLVADGPRVGWVEGGDPPAFVVYDQSTGETVRDPLQNVEGMSDVRDGQDAAVMYALDGDLAYVKTQQGAAAWNTATGDLTFLDTEANGFTITDAKNGLISYRPAGAGDEQVIRVGSTLDSGTALPLWDAYDLSPDGRYLMGEAESDDVRIFDTGTGEALPKDDYGYAYFGGYQWIDSDHYAALGFHEPTDSDLVDILSCTVVTGVCTPVAQDVGSIGDGLVIPIGIYNS